MINRLRNASVLAVICIGVAHAGPVLGPIQTQIGGVNGLTSSAFSASTNTTAVNYDTTVFAGLNNAAVPYTGYQQNTATTGTITDSTGSSNVVFDMINNGTTGGGDSVNAWQISANTGSVTIPIGIYGVTDLWTMANLSLGSGSLGRDMTISMTFSTQLVGGTLTTVTIRPYDTNQAGGTGTVRDAIDCTVGSGGNCTSGNSASGQIAGAIGNPSSNPTSFANGGSGGQVSVGTLSEYTDNLFSTSYTAGATGTYANTTGNLVLDDQGWIFTGALASLAAGDYLQSIQIKDTATGSNSALYLSAVTVDSSGATPEPSTIVIFTSGLVGLMLLVRRTRRA